MTDTNPSIGKLMAKGAGWMVMLRFLVRIIGFVRTVILARLLVPADFGLVALAMMILGLAEAVTKLRPDFALIQNTQAERLHYDTVWTITVIRGAVMAIVLALLAAACARFFEEPRLEPIIYCLALVVFAEGFQNVAKDSAKDVQFPAIHVVFAHWCCRSTARTLCRFRSICGVEPLHWDMLARSIHPDGHVAVHLEQGRVCP